MKAIPVPRPLVLDRALADDLRDGLRACSRLAEIIRDRGQEYETRGQADAIRDSLEHLRTRLIACSRPLPLAAASARLRSAAKKGGPK